MVQLDTSVTGHVNGGNSIILPGITTGGGNRLLILRVSYSNGSASVSSITGGSGITWHSAGTRIAQNGSSSNGYTELWYSFASSTQSNVAFTINLGGLAFPQATAVLEAWLNTDVTGVGGAGAIGKYATASGNSGTASISATTTRNNSLVTAAIGISKAVVVTAGASQTITNQVEEATGGFSTVAGVEQNSITTLSGTSVTMSGTFTSNTWAIIFLEIKGPASTTYTFTADGMMLATTKKTFTADAILTTHTTFTVDGILASPKQFTVDGLVHVSGETKTFTADGVMYMPWTSLYGAHVSRNPSAKSDNFNENYLDAALWSNTFNAFDSNQVKVQNSRLEITHSATANQYNSLQSRYPWDLTGGAFTVQVTDAGNQALVSHGTNLAASKDGSNNIFMSASNGQLSAFKTVSGTQTQIGTGITYSATTHLWWRIRESGGTIFFDTSADNITWTNRWSVANPFAVTALSPYCQTGCYNTETSGSHAYFDNFTFPNNVLEIDQFIIDAGRRPQFIEIYQEWGNSDPSWSAFSPGTMDAIVARDATPMLTWEPWTAANGTTQAAYTLASIYNGSHDAYIIAFAQAAQSWGKPFYMRFAHEMNGTWYPWAEAANGNAAGDYAKAWKYVHDLFNTYCSYASWVWCVNVDFVGGTTISELYPGNAYVDWMAVDGYNWGTLAGHPGWQTFTQIFVQTYTELVAISNKGIMITEVASAESGGDKAKWIKDAFESEIYNYPQFKAFLWFNENKENDWRIESTTTATAAFKTAISALSVPYTIQVDGIVLAQGGIKQFTADGIIKATSTKTFTVDGIMTTKVFKTFTADGIVKATNTNTFTVDAVISGLLSDFVDNFNSGADLSGSKWSYDPANTDLINGQLVFNGAAEIDTDSVNLYSLGGSSISFELIHVDPSLDNQFNFNLTDPQQGDGVTWYQSGGTFIGYYADSILTDITVASISYDRALHRFFRIRETSGTTYWETSKDGQSWTVQGSVSTSLIGVNIHALRLDIYTLDEAIPPQNSIIDNVNFIPTPKIFTGDGIIQITQTKTFTSDGIMKVTTIKTVTVDGILSASSSKTFTSDGVVVAKSTKTITADAIMLATQTKTITIDGIMFSTNTKTFTVDGVVDVTGNIKTFTADGIMKSTQTKTFTVDGIMDVTGNLKTFTTDGIVIATTFKQFTLDGILKATQSFTFTSNGILQSTQTKTFTVDGIMVATTPKTFTIDGIVKATNTKTFTADGIIKATTTKTVTADGIIDVTSTKTFTTDGIVKATQIQTVTADGILKATTIKTFTTDGVMIYRLPKTFTADGIVKTQGITASFTADGIMNISTIETFTIDAVMLNSPKFYVTADAIVYAATISPIYGIPYGFYLHGWKLKNPVDFKKDYVYRRTDTLVMSGKSVRDFTGLKQKYTLTFKNLSPSQVEVINQIMALKAPVTFTVDGSDVVVVNTTVWPYVGSITYQTLGDSYLADATIELVEKG